MRPLNNNVIVRILEDQGEEHVSDGGIILTRDLEYPSLDAEVMAVSEDVESAINTGDIVLIPKHEGVPFSHKKEDGTVEVVRVIDVSKIFMIK